MEKSCPSFFLGNGMRGNGEVSDVCVIIWSQDLGWLYSPDSEEVFCGENDSSVWV